MKNFKPFSTTLIGSMPRSNKLLSLKEKLQKDSSLKKEYDKMVFDETKFVVNMLDKIGIDVVISGEISRDNYMSYVAEHVYGIKLMATDQILSLTENKGDFNKSLKEMDASDNSMNSPICVDRIKTDVELDIDEVKMIKKITDSDFKMTLPSPYLLTRSMWLKEVTGKVYENRNELGKDVVKLLINEIKRLVSLGAKVIQIDEPILSEVVFKNTNSSNSFYWGALSAKVKVDRELKFAGQLLSEIFAEIRKYDDVLSVMHVCRGNWTCDESVLLEGAYDKLSKFFDSLDVDMLALEFSTPRAGEISQLFKNNDLNKKIMLGLGCINPRIPRVETVDEIVERVQKALEFLPPEKIWLNPDCGFATFAKRPLNPYNIIEEKLSNMVKASHILREKYCK